VSDPLQRPPVSRESHAERVRQARSLAFDAGKSIDDALAENASSTPVRRAKAAAMLDRAFPGTTQDDYDAYDAAEADILDRRARSVDQGLLDKDDVGHFGPGNVVIQMENLRRSDDDAYRKLIGINSEWYRYDDERATNYDAGRRREQAAAWKEVKQVGAQSEWDTFIDSRDIDPYSDLYEEVMSYREPQKQNVITAVGNRESYAPGNRWSPGPGDRYWTLQMSSQFPSNRLSRSTGLPTQRNLETLAWHREHLGHDIVGEEGDYARSFSDDN
jgi:hypothetical protein